MAAVDQDRGRQDRRHPLLATQPSQRRRARANLPADRRRVRRLPEVDDRRDPLTSNVRTMCPSAQTWTEGHMTFTLSNMVIR